jgi:hypothetical protein
MIAVLGVLMLAAVAHARNAARQHPLAAAVAGALGVSPQELVTDLRNGQTLTQIATANGKPVSGLEQAIMTGAKARLDQAVAAGHLSGQAEQTILTRLSGRLDTLVTVEHPVAHALAGLRLRAAVARLVAGYLGLTPLELRSQLTAGKTLGQIASDQGKTASGLEQAVEAAVKTRLDQAVTAGKLSSANEQKLLTALQTRLDSLVANGLK